jgi:hypothetical protein
MYELNGLDLQNSRPSLDEEHMQQFLLQEVTSARFICIKVLLCAFNRQAIKVYGETEVDSTYS